MGGSRGKTGKGKTGKEIRCPESGGKKKARKSENTMGTLQ